MKDHNNLATLTAIQKHRIEDFFEAFTLYVVKRYGADLGDPICDWNMVGATFRYYGCSINIQLKVWERSNGEFNLPDNVVIVYGFDTVPEFDETEFRALLFFIMEQGSRHGFKHIASQAIPVRFGKNAVPDTTIPCLKFA